MPSTDPTNPTDPLASLLGSLYEEEQGYDVPFALLTWAEWLEMQTRLQHHALRFQRAIEHRQIALAMQIALEAQQITLKMVQEASSWILDPPDEKG